MVNKINFFHSIIIFNFAILLSPINILQNKNFLIYCLFFILIIGISHGALDNVKGRKLLNIFKIKNILVFYILYILLSASTIFFWLIFPNLLLLVFLIIASYHFGKEDTVFKIQINGFIKELLFFFKGSAVIFAPLLFNQEKTVKIFEMLNFNLFKIVNISPEILIFVIFLSFISNLILAKKEDLNLKSILILDFFSVILLNYFLEPILAFTIYFCFLHSIRHSISLTFELDKKIKNGIKKFVIKSLPLTLITAILYIISIYFLNNFYELNNAIYKVIFIGLASLTFPHILLEYLLEKYEK
tara:strand:+ start:396 stop:1298 length:903 start_codon:yes stop_codon:yes gene_type:complete